MTSQVRVRFAPSPTGYLHVGGARTALFNWLYARHHGGVFILRIEDTDAQRSTKEFEEEILTSMRWLGLNWDEGPVYQSSRFPVYREYAQKLLDRGVAYKSNDPEKGSGDAIIYKMPSKRISVQDMIYGTVEFDSDLLKDQVLIKSDGTPAYNFACVVDDAQMRIDPVIRGEDHLSNTPKQIALYEALELPAPRYAHVPLILGQDRSRLSKRHGATSVTNYRQEGYLPEALVNYLVLLGWSPGDNQELFELDALIRAFSLENVSRKGAVFSPEKLQWMNAQYLKNLPSDRLVREVKPFLGQAGLLDKNQDEVRIGAVAVLLKERMKLLKDIAGLGACFFQEEISIDPAAAEKHLMRPENQALFSQLVDALRPLTVFSSAEIERVVRGAIEAGGVKSTPVIQAMRVALTGRSVSAGIFETMEVMGKDVCLKRLSEARERIAHEPGK